MVQSIWATVQEGQVKLPDSVSLPEGAKLLVTVVSNNDERDLWYKAQEMSMKAVWDNPADDVYGELLKE